MSKSREGLERKPADAPAGERMTNPGPGTGADTGIPSTSRQTEYRSRESWREYPRRSTARGRNQLDTSTQSESQFGTSRNYTQRSSEYGGQQGGDRISQSSRPTRTQGDWREGRSGVYPRDMSERFRDRDLRRGGYQERGENIRPSYARSYDSRREEERGYEADYDRGRREDEFSYNRNRVTPSAYEDSQRDYDRGRRTSGYDREEQDYRDYRPMHTSGYARGYSAWTDTEASMADYNEEYDANYDTRYEGRGAQPFGYGATGYGYGYGESAYAEQGYGRRQLRVSDIMTKDVTTVAPTASLRDVADKMQDDDVGSVPVVENGRLVGIVTDRDIVCRALAEGRDTRTIAAREIMSEDLITCSPDESVIDAIHKMGENQVRRIPVCDTNGRLRGIMSMADVALEAERDVELAHVLEQISQPNPQHGRRR